MALNLTTRYLIRKALDEDGMSQAELARRTGHSAKHVSSVLTGKDPLTMALADELLEATGRQFVLRVELIEE